MIIYKIVLYNNYICLLTHFSGTRIDDVDVEGEFDILVRLYKIPPSPAAYLDNVLL